MELTCGRIKRFDLPGCGTICPQWSANDAAAGIVEWPGHVRHHGPLRQLHRGRRRAGHLALGGGQGHRPAGSAAGGAPVPPHHAAHRADHRWRGVLRIVRGGAGRNLRRRGLPGFGRPAQRAAAHRHAILVRAPGGAAGAVAAVPAVPGPAVDDDLHRSFRRSHRGRHRPADPLRRAAPGRASGGAAAGAPATGHLRIAGVPAGARRAAHGGGTGAAPQHCWLPPRATGVVADR